MNDDGNIHNKVKKLNKASHNSILNNISPSTPVLFSFFLFFSPSMSVISLSISSSCSKTSISATVRVGSTIFLVYFDIGFLFLNEHEVRKSLTKFLLIISVWIGLNSGLEEDNELLLLELLEVGMSTDDVDEAEDDTDVDIVDWYCCISSLKTLDIWSVIFC